MSPGLLFLAAIAIYPTIYSLVLSFTQWRITTGDAPRFVGFDNYSQILADPAFWNSVRVTFTFVVFSVAIEFALAFLLALVFFRGLPGEKIMRSLILLPMLCAPVVIGLLARFSLEPNFGIVNQLMRSVGLPTTEFLGSPDLALPTLIAIDIWQWTPFLFLIFLAAMQGIPEDIIEASKLDGATWPRIVWHQFLPLLKYPIMVGLLLRLIDTFRVYDIVFMTTRGGPIDVTSTMSWQIYDVGFRSFTISYAAAYSWLMLIIVLTMMNFLIRRMAVRA
ncbi:carbohydrate ABC transporter permease [Microcella alkaliphila]|uniref:ABC transporter permease protein n=1 Tax=Microcella alkaliphila TaxID=279828 RepID=A0A0U5CI02_9MICO|nr:sugar ABC transporter permease [Microcella alkaliphila]BAU33394.1 ABC transporter permease protein [Microcella alkaliphila]